MGEGSTARGGWGDTQFTRLSSQLKSQSALSLSHDAGATRGQAHLATKFYSCHVCHVPFLAHSQLI
jgi:hypothetical protein